MENAQDVVETAIVLDWNIVANIAVGTCAGIVGAGAIYFVFLVLLSMWNAAATPRW